MTKKKPAELLTPLMSVKIRGTVYPTVRDAARAFKVSETNIRALLHRGRIDRVGMGKSRKTPGPQIPPKPIKVNGREFPSMQFLSLYLGKSKQWVSNTLNRYADGMERVAQEHLRHEMAKTAKQEVELAKQIQDQMYEHHRKLRY